MLFVRETPGTRATQLINGTVNGHLHEHRTMVSGSFWNEKKGGVVKSEGYSSPRKYVWHTHTHIYIYMRRERKLLFTMRCINFNVF